MITVRRAGERDIAAIAGIESAAAQRPWSCGQFSEELTLPHARLLCAEDKGEVVGFLDMHIAADDAHINELGVAVNCRRRGIGETLVRFSDKVAKSEGCTVLSLEVREGNGAARALYEKCGFKPVGTRKRFYKTPDEDGIIMLKEL